jgi:hypothetical protein
MVKDESKVLDYKRAKFLQIETQKTLGEAKLN